MPQTRDDVVLDAAGQPARPLPRVYTREQDPDGVLSLTAEATRKSLPVLIFCATKRACESTASKVAE